MTKNVNTLHVTKYEYFTFKMNKLMNKWIVWRETETNIETLNKLSTSNSH